MPCALLKAGSASKSLISLNGLFRREGQRKPGLGHEPRDVDTFRKLKQLGIKFIVKKVPSSNAEDMDALLDKAQKLIDEQKK